MIVYPIDSLDLQALLVLLLISFLLLIIISYFR